MPKTVKKAPRRRAPSWMEFRIELDGHRRQDGSLFVTSRNLEPFSAVLEKGNWEAVIPLLKKFLQKNFGPVKEIRLIHDASELMLGELPDIPAPYIIAEMTPERARAV